ncbi:MAG: DUF3791 domain-containing protein [Clostridium sp.]|nr:DUF3791 domain-containing protein [Clostridium sp.]
MDKEKIEYIVVVVGEFARQYNISYKDAYWFIRRNNGLDLLDKGYSVEHTFSIEETIHNIHKYCTRQNQRHK